MPSPIAHAAVALLAPPLMARSAAVRLSRPRQVAFVGLVTLALCIPDVDFLLPLLTTLSTAEAHGAWTHSLLAGAVFACIFAPIARGVVGGLWPWRRLALIGLGCYWLHIAMDVFTSGRGVMALWPLTDRRFFSPLPIFTGIHWADPSRWDLHARTAANEGLFVAAMIAGAVAIARVRRGGATL